MLRPTTRRRAARLASLWPTADSRQPTVRPRRGLTLIEMLIATAITLLMMAAVVNLFANLSGSIRNRRAVIEMSAQVRQVRQRLARDLANCTVPSDPRGLVPWQRRGEAVGYFEIVEGNRSDVDPSILVNGVDDPPDDPEIDPYALSLIPRNNMVRDYNNDGRVDEDDEIVHNNYVDSLRPSGLGDWDDFIAFTVRSDNEPFVAQVGGQTVESQLAEIIWFAIEHQPGANPPDEPGMRSIHRRVMLIAPWVSISGNNQPNNLSAHLDRQSGQWVANTLADLTRRENRYRHRFNPNAVDLAFPHELEQGQIRGEVTPTPANPNAGTDSLMLTDVLAWDVRVYDPGAPLYQIGSAATNTIVDPNDPGWQSAVGGTPVAFGAYVDLGWNNAGTYVPPTGAPPTHFQQERRVGWHPRFVIENDDNTLFRGTPATYDTWSWHYENDGVNQDQFDLGPQSQWRADKVDQGVNGIDDNGLNGVDDVMERETSPPYNVPLRGVKVVLRAYERNSRQVREASVTNSFVP